MNEVYSTFKCYVKWQKMKQEKPLDNGDRNQTDYFHAEDGYIQIPR